MKITLTPEEQIQAIYDYVFKMTGQEIDKSDVKCNSCYSIYDIEINIVANNRDNNEN